MLGTVPEKHECQVSDRQHDRDCPQLTKEIAKENSNTNTKFQVQKTNTNPIQRVRILELTNIKIQM